MTSAVSPKKVAVLGTAATVAQAPVLDPSWEIWACSAGLSGGVIPRIDRFYEIHAPEAQTGVDVEPFFKWLATLQRVDVFHDLGLPNQVFYPRAKIEAMHGSWFFTSTIAWMLAHAIDEGATEIGVWGVDMASDGEYGDQKFGCLHFLQLARLAGIAVTLPVESELLRVKPPYPDRYATPTAIALQSHRFAAQERLEKLDLERIQAQQVLRDIERRDCFEQGALNALRKMERLLT